VEGAKRLFLKKFLQKYSLLLFLLIVLAVTFIELPFYVTQPGDAQDLTPLVAVEDGYETKGSFMLTTVLVGKANVVNYIWAKLSDYRDLYSIEDIRREDESDDEYHQRQLHYMENSKETAIIVAYKKAGKFIEIKESGLVVLSLIEGMPSEEVLKVGDKIVAVDKKAVFNHEDLQTVMDGKNKGDTVTLQIIRDENTKTVSLPLVAFPEKYQKAGTEEKFGIGISHKVARELTADPNIKVDSEGIGGPSAGLMFTLAIYNQLVEKDLTAGLKVAGTGTISEDGTVGPIGGIKHKVVAADNAGVDIFFAPNEQGDKESNYNDAVKVAEDLGITMKIVPVDTFEDALNYLTNLK
jgi:Lon-like protease